MNSAFLFPALLLTALLAGCHSGTLPAAGKETAADRQLVESERQELQLIPPPSKTRYLAVRSLDTWENPYLTVQPDMVTLHVLVADANPTDLGVGGLMRPLSARRQDLNVSLDKLGEALRAVPRTAWPYGRVAAVEEARKTPAAGQAQVRRTMEATLKTLNDVGVVVYEWNESSPK